jgi:hypothetical protein
VNAFVEECRREWKRLGVPDLLADEMAAELEADLAEAEAEGVSAAEIVGESDPRRFAATWASERGLVSEPAQKSRRRIWPWIVAVLVLLVALFVSWIALQTLGTSSQANSSPPVQVRPQRTPSRRVPDLVGMTACQANRAAVEAGLTIHDLPKHSCTAIVVAQMPAAGARVQQHAPRAVLRLRLRRR